MIMRESTVTKISETAPGEGSLRLIRKPRSRSKRKIPGALGQVQAALSPDNRLATLLGAVFGGGGVPIASWQLAHHEIEWAQPLAGQPALWLVLGGLLFSAITVYSWAYEAFETSRKFVSVLKAVGFTLLLEGTLTCAKTAWLSGAGLAYLVFINAMATGVRLSKGGPS
jgi:hypothetical protein